MMKPLPVIQLTLEDWQAWHWSEPDWNDLARLELMDAYEAADDRDFRLMRIAQLCPDVSGVRVDLCKTLVRLKYPIVVLA